MKAQVAMPPRRTIADFAAGAEEARRSAATAPRRGRAPDGRGELLLVALVAAWARWAWLPLERHRFDGHEADYLLAFQGGVLEPSTRHVPLLAGVYRALGRVTDDAGWLLELNLAAGLVTVLAGASLARRHRLAAGLLLALSPSLVFWSASAYHVAIPVALAVLGAAVGGWPGALLYALGCANRLELALLAPAVGVLGGWRVACGGLGALAGWPLLSGAPALRPLSETLPVNVLLPDYLGALGSGWGLLIVLAALRVRTLPLLAAAAWVHLVGACFDDYGTRHGLIGALVLGVLVARCRRPWVIAVALAWSAWQTAQVVAWFYAPQERFAATVPDLGAPPPCTEVLDDPLAEASHWEAREDWPEGLVCWGEERIHRAWTSRSLQDRALRMRRTYELAPIGVLRLESGPRVLYSVGR